MTKRKIVCLCGSTIAHEHYVEANLQETLKGHIVLSVGVFGHVAAKVHGREIDLTPHKEALDQLHHDKVRMADEIVIVGRVGQSTGAKFNSQTNWESPSAIFTPMLRPAVTTHQLFERAVISADQTDHTDH